MADVILLDLDGTIIDSYHSVRWAIEQSLDYFKIQIPSELHEEKEVGKLLFVVKSILPESIPMAMFKDIYDRILATAPLDRIIVTEETKLFLRQLKQSGYRLVVLTNKNETIAKTVCLSLFPEDTFTEIIGRVTSRPIKPFPNVFARLTDYNIAIESLKCLIGDSDEDKDTAMILGIPFYNVRQYSLCCIRRNLS